MTLRIALFGLAGALAGCGSPAPPTPATFSSLESASGGFTWKRSCGLSVACHSAAQRRTGFIDLETDPYHALVGQATSDATYPAAAGRYPTLVVPGDPTRSFLYVKLKLPPSSVPDPTLGYSMPQFTDSLDADTLERFRSWIAAGALNN